METGEYWLAYAYAPSAALAAAALRNLREAKRVSRAAAAESGLAAGSVTFAGALALGGCFLVGCCGSPMLAVWASLFGLAFLPFAKPLIAGVTTVTVVAAGSGWRGGIGPDRAWPVSHESGRAAVAPDTAAWLLLVKPG